MKFKKTWTFSRFLETQDVKKKIFMNADDVRVTGVFGLAIRHDSFFNLFDHYIDQKRMGVL